MELLRKLIDGDVVPGTVTLVEGITFAEMRSQLESTKDSKVTLKGLPDAGVLKKRRGGENKDEGSAQ